jgi:tetratricopeptide (TPR) repeat protein
MRGCSKTALALVAVATLFPACCSSGWAANDSISAAQCSVAGGRDASNNTVTCNFGLTPEQLRQITNAAVEGVTAPLMDQVVNISKRLGVTENAARTLLRIAGQQADIPNERLAETLTKIATDYKRLQEQLAALSTDNPIAQKLVEQARPEIDAGHFQRADDLLRDAEQAQLAAAEQAEKLAEQATAAKDAQRLGAARITATRAEVALTERRYRQAAELFGRAAAFVPPAKAEERRSYVKQQAATLFTLGDELGNNEALGESIGLYRQVIATASRGNIPLEWAAIHANLGRALTTLGKRENGTAHLEEAIASFRSALEEVRRAQVPLQWAETQNNLAVALQLLGERESGTAHLEEAIAAQRAALEEVMREEAPLDWASMELNLGSALAKLSEREDGTARLEEAVAAYQAALKEFTRDRVPLSWAATQTGLAGVLLMLGERESGTGRFQDAIAACRAALQESTRERAPLVWADIQNTLGTALSRLGERESGTRYLEEGVAAYRAALEEYRRDRVPLDWAMVQNNLGVALSSLGTRGHDTQRLYQAIAAHHAALQEITRQTAPLDWAAAQHNIGDTYLILGAVEKAVEAYHAALEERTRERVPLLWADTQMQLGNALAASATQKHEPELMQEAIKSTRAAAAIYAQRGESSLAQRSQNRLLRMRIALSGLRELRGNHSSIRRRDSRARER